MQTHGWCSSFQVCEKKIHLGCVVLKNKPILSRGSTTNSLAVAWVASTDSEQVTEVSGPRISICTQPSNIFSNSFNVFKLEHKRYRHLTEF